jgi:hypothetical protein
MTMTKITALLVSLIITSIASAQSAMDKAEQRLAELVAPGSALASSPSPQIAWKASAAVAGAELPMPVFAGVTLRLAQAPLKQPKPGVAPEGPPLANFQDKTKTPKQVELPTKPLIKLPSLDVNTPLPIPTLAQPTKDRASLGDPSFDISLQAAMKPFSPQRTRPVPFTPYNLPDPFEHARYGQLRNPPEESATPPVLPLQRPK